MTYINHVSFPILNNDDEENYSPEENPVEEEMDDLENEEDEEDDYSDYNYEE